MIFWIYILVALLSFSLSALIGIYLIPLLKKIHFGQTIYDKGPAWHKDKQGTPIMGGFMFIIGSIVATAVGYILYRYTCSNSLEITSGNKMLYKLIVAIVYALLNSFIGFLDDYIKAVKKQNLGLNAKQKMIMQFIFSAAFLLALYILGDTATYIEFPLVGRLNLGYFYYPIMLLYMVYLTNAVNLTDGIDGLCGTVTVVSALSLVVMCCFLDYTSFSIFSMAIAGACLGFLVWNLHPAKVFMGDTGSMFLGGTVVAIGFATRQHVLLAIIALVYILEALSVVLQVISFKTTGKRIFKMSPIHHHFEMIGYSEYKIVITFSTVGLIAGIVANVIMKLSLK